MRLRWVPLLLLLPLADAALLAYLAGAVLGWQVTVLLVVLTALIGLLLVRAEGRRTIRRLQRAVAEGRSPADALLDGGLLIAAGAFLLTPGLVSDAVGLLCVLPPTRIPIRHALKRWVVVPYAERRTGGFVTGGVYTGGFPGEASGGWPGPGGDWSGPDDGPGAGPGGVGPTNGGSGGFGTGSDDARGFDGDFDSFGEWAGPGDGPIDGRDDRPGSDSGTGGAGRDGSGDDVDDPPRGTSIPIDDE